MTPQSQSRKTSNVNAVVTKRQNTLSFIIKNKKRKTEADTVKSSDERGIQQEDEVCTI